MLRPNPLSPYPYEAYRYPHVLVGDAHARRRLKSRLGGASAPIDRLRGRVCASAKADDRPKALLPHTSSVSGYGPHVHP